MPRNNLLQWGHGREAMDGELARRMELEYDILQWGHGREAMDGDNRPPPVSGSADFNGAMAVRPWMAADFVYLDEIQSVLQWGHGREAMDGSAPCPWPHSQ